MFPLSINSLIVCNFLPISLVFAFKTGVCMVLFGIALRRFLFCFVFCVVEILTVLGVFIVRWGCPGLWGCFVVLVFAFSLAFVLRVRVRTWLGAGGHQNQMCVVLPSS